MNRRAYRWILMYIIAPPLLLLRFIFKPIWLLLGLLDQPLARRNERKLRLDVADAIPFLFQERHARVIPNEGVPSPPGFDYAFVTVEVENMLIRFCRGRGELEVQVGSTQKPRNLYELSLVLSLLDENGVCKRGESWSLYQAGWALESHMGILKRALGEGVDEELARRLRDSAVDDRIAIREAEWEINKGLRSHRG